MSKGKRDWKSISVPENIFGRIKAILWYVGDMSIAEYARQAIEKRLHYDEINAEAQKDIQKEIKARLKDDE